MGSTAWFRPGSSGPKPGPQPIESSLLRKYEFVVTACDRFRVSHLDSVKPIRLDED